MSKNESGDYNGPAENDFYADDSTEMESFDDLGDDDFEETEIQGTTSNDDMDDYDDEGNVIEEKPAPKKAPSKKEAAKKARGQKGDDMEALDLDEEDDEQIRNIDDEDEEEEEEDDKKKSKKEEEEEDEEEEKPEDKKPEEKGEKKTKGKPSYVTIDGESFAVPSDALIATPVDGKVEKVTLQELKNNYAGKVAYDKRFNEVNLKEQAVKKTSADLEQKITKFSGVKEQIEQIITDAEKNPKDALKIFLDAFGVDSYDLEERMFKADLTELANVLAMEPAERKAHFLEKKTNHLLNQAEKRKAAEAEEQKRKSYTQKTDALRKSSGVSEVQYVDAYEELLSFGHTDKDLTEKDIVEWAATKPHRTEVETLMEPYKDQFSREDYGELSWKLVKILQSGAETPDVLRKNLAAVYGVPTEVKQLSKKLNPLGRKTKAAPQKPTSKKANYESFDDIDDDE